MRDVSSLLDTARWVSAWLVACSHCRNLLLVDWEQLADHGLMRAGFYWLTGFGRISVVVFFVLSGYLVGGQALTAIAAGRFDVREYVVNRLARLYPPLLAALLLTALLDQAGLRWGNGYGYYDFPNTYGVAGETHSITQGANVATGIVNLLFMQTIVGPTFGSNSPLWSLANEFWYYAFIPLASLLFFRAVRQRVHLLGALGVVALGVAWMPQDMALLSVTWLLGAIAYCFARSLNMGVSYGLLVLFICGAAAIRTMHPFAAAPLLNDLIIGGLFAAVLWSRGRPMRRGVANGLSARLAGFSYSLYLVHVPLMFLLAAMSLQFMDSSIRLQADLTASVLFVAGMALSTALAYGVSRVTEARTSDIRRWLRRRFALGAAAVRS